MTEANPYRVVLNGGPYDGTRSELPHRADVIGMAPVTEHGPTVAYHQTGAIAADGAHVFEYVPEEELEPLTPEEEAEIEEAFRRAEDEDT